MAETSYIVSGTLYKKNPIQVVSEKFKKIDFIVKTDGEYPQYLQIQAGNDKTSLLDGLHGGDRVICTVNVKGRLWTGSDGIEKCFNSLEIWKLDKQGSGQHIETVQAEVVQPTDPLGDSSNLPF
jgi:hypothetical protein